MAVGAGRKTKDDKIDPAVGVVLNKKCGDEVSKGEPLAVLHYNNKSLQDETVERLRRSFTIDTERPEERPLIYKIVK